MDTQLTLLAVDPVAVEPVDPDSIRVLTWNVQHAAPERARRQAMWLASTRAHALLLTEVAGGDSGRVLGQALAERGYAVHIPHPPAANPDYRVLLAWRDGDLDLVDGGVGVLPHRCVAARLRLAAPATVDRPEMIIGLVGLYVPSRGSRERRNVDKRAFQAAVAAALPMWVSALVSGEGPLLVCGDLNVVEPGHVPAHTNFGAWEYDFYTAFAAHGLVDAFRHHHPDLVDHSWYGRRSGDGYRFDHLFCDASGLSWVVECAYDHTPRLAGLSDHAALGVTLTVPGA